MNISEEIFFSLPEEEQCEIIKGYLKEFSRNDLLAVKHLIENIDNPCSGKNGPE